jgi:C4-dicarboxylate-specific signal transduction histidine kinase
VITEVHSSLSVKIGHAELVQVLVSLLSNAGQATGPGPNTVHVHASALEGGRVAIEVSDTGVGMDGATLEHAFEPFYTTKGIGRGRGLGLSVCLGIVESAGGEIRLTSEVGMGTIATVIFLAAANGNELVQP